MHDFPHLNETSSSAVLWAEPHISQMTLEIHFVCMENPFSILGREAERHSWDFHPVMEAWHEEPALQGSVGADPDWVPVTGRVIWAFPHWGTQTTILKKHLSLHEFNHPALHGSVISFVKTSRKPERWASPKHKPKWWGGGQRARKQCEHPKKPRAAGLMSEWPLGGEAEAMKDEPPLRNSSEHFLLTLWNRHLPVRDITKSVGTNKSTFQLYLHVSLAMILD